MAGQDTRCHILHTFESCTQSPAVLERIKSEALCAIAHLWCPVAAGSAEETLLPGSSGGLPVPSAKVSKSGLRNTGLRCWFARVEHSVSHRRQPGESGRPTANKKPAEAGLVVGFFENYFFVENRLISHDC